MEGEIVGESEGVVDGLDEGDNEGGMVGDDDGNEEGGVVGLLVGDVEFWQILPQQEVAHCWKIAFWMILFS